MSSLCGRQTQTNSILLVAIPTYLETKARMELRKDRYLELDNDEGTFTWGELKDEELEDEDQLEEE